MFDHLDDYLAHYAGSAGVTGLPGFDRLRCLMYADDVFLADGTVDGLNKLLVGLSRFCEHWDFEVNYYLGKSKAMAIGVPKSRGSRSRRLVHSPVIYRGVTLQYVAEYTYLGVPFHGQKGFTEAFHARAQQVQKAYYSMLAKCKEHRILQSVNLRLRLFDSLVTPVGDWGCLAWAGQFVARTTFVDAARNNPVEQAHLMFLRELLRVPTSVSLANLYRETGRWPWSVRWLAHMIRW